MCVTHIAVPEPLSTEKILGGVPDFFQFSAHYHVLDSQISRNFVQPIALLMVLLRYPRVLSFGKLINRARESPPKRPPHTHTRTDPLTLPDRLLHGETFKKAFFLQLVDQTLVEKLFNAGGSRGAP